MTEVYELPDVVILTGGLGTRLRSSVSDRPKTMAAVAGRPFLEYVVEQVKRSHFARIVFCVGFLAEHIQSHFGTHDGSLEFDYSVETALLGTAGALRFAVSKVNSSSMLVMNGDSYCDVDLAQFWKWHVERRSSASIVITSVNDTKRYGRVNVDQDSRITSFDEKGSVSGPGFINAGIYLLNKSIIQDLPPGRILSIERDVFPTLTSGLLHGFNAQASRFIDIGTPESLDEAQELFTATQSTSSAGGAL